MGGGHRGRDGRRQRVERRGASGVVTRPPKGSSISQLHPQSTSQQVSSMEFSYLPTLGKGPGLGMVSGGRGYGWVPGLLCDHGYVVSPVWPAVL